MFNSFVKSMMALCMVTSGWSSNGSNGSNGIDGRDYLAPSGGVTEVAPGSGPITAVGNDDKLPLDGGKSPRKISDDSVQSKTSPEISSQEEPTSDGAVNTSTSSDEGTSPQKEGGVVVGATPMNDALLLDEDIANKREPKICKFAVQLSINTERYRRKQVKGEPAEELQNKVIETIEKVQSAEILDRDSLFAPSFYTLIHAISSANKILGDKMPQDTIDSLKGIADSLECKYDGTKEEAIECIKNSIYAQYC